MPTIDQILASDEERRQREAAAASGVVPGPLDGYGARVRSAQDIQADLNKLDNVGLFTPEQTKELSKRYYDSITGGQTDDAPKTRDPATGKLVSTKPNWYKPGGPTTVKPGWGALGAGLGALAEGAQQRAGMIAKRPGVWNSTVHKAQQQATLAGIGSAVGNYLINKDKNDSDAGLDRALKEAQMYRVLNPGRAGGSAGGLAEALRLNAAYGNLGARVVQAGDVLQRANTEQARKADEDNPSSPISRQAAQAAVDTGAAPPEIVGTWSVNQIKQQLPTLRAMHEKTLASMERVNGLIDKQKAEIEKEERERSEKIVAQQMPTVQWRENFVSSPQNTEEVRNIVTGRITSLQATKRLQEISQYFQDKYGGGTVGGVRQWIKEHGYNFDQEDEAMLAEAALHKQTLGTGVRMRNQMGAPTGIELQLSTRLTDSSQTVGGLLYPQEFYDGVAKAVNDGAAAALFSRNAWLPGMKPLEPLERDTPKPYTPAPVDYRMRGSEARTPGQSPAPQPLPGANLPAEPQQVPAERPPQAPPPNSAAPIVQPQAAVPAIPADARVAPQEPEPLPDNATRKQRIVHAAKQEIADAVRGATGGKTFVVDFGDGQPPIDATAEEAEQARAAGAKVTAKPAANKPAKGRASVAPKAKPATAKRYMVDFGDGQPPLEVSEAEANEARAAGAKVTEVK